MKSSLEALIAINKVQQTLLQRMTKRYQLTVSEWQLLDHIGGGENTQEILAQQTRLDTSTLSRQLKGLVAKEMVTKEAIGRDKRQLIYTITEQGTQTAAAINTAFEDLSDQIFEHWSTDERNLLQILLNRLDKSLDRRRGLQN
ncbi:MarR family winged helix-turn-helix transcriptional regulator [Levilactobacillus brevis]|jgi:DNA-binding MarR family transcriptional regulator|uniref:Transcriptional regulator, MarR family n=4 Tax=Levilactobacillus brevis TaxID=1580 RepID=Q03S52_LEVBA|nr:MarR family winged helix-turn-helix transcriptional regulator [Levilactobacillus brevis]MBL3536720.1 winged helix-turn-helix transcriptional regulator [Lactobacillus sp. GPR40-2]MBL3629878.1 winged helix-turn-helix transcriptional regulator [Lactobacillus sp. GPB7-4]TYA98823.1 winged helix-turn-helix transcriptional regulator [Lactobacillus sp. SL9-6]ABJ63970.1 transcriptional regulator, MarR family [Levilactobacillus brevis ATCC 367]ANN49039.1 MarR family transcriptional regulator [Levilac